MEKPPKRIDLNSEDIDALLDRVQSNSLTPEDHEIIKGLFETVEYLGQLADQKGQSVKRLLRMLFGSKTEKSSDILGSELNPEVSGADEEDADTPEEPDPPEKPIKGHGRRKASDYLTGERICVHHESLKSGEVCPKCHKGKVYPVKDPKTLVRVKGNTPFTATVYELEKLRCRLCGKVFTAQPKEDIGDERYDDAAMSMIALLKYGTGVPFARLERLQETLGVPLSASNQWDIVYEAYEKVLPVFRMLNERAAQARLIHNDDTVVKILEEMKRKKDVSGKSPPKRTGLYTTGVVAELEEYRIALFYSGQKHAGENLADLLKQRARDLGPPIQMCDGMPSNIPKEFDTILSNCLAHSRRKFVEIYDNFPESCAHIIKVFRLIYKNDATAKDKEMDSEQRLRYHQNNSAPAMIQLKKWVQEQMDEKWIEPNSGLGDAIRYMLKRWEPLTEFMRTPGTPLDNNVCERALKKAILSRKNAYFYKTLRGAKTGDLFMSIIHTCELNQVNPFEYMKSILKNYKILGGNTGKWMPWNYKSMINDAE